MDRDGVGVQRRRAASAQIESQSIAPRCNPSVRRLLLDRASCTRMEHEALTRTVIGAAMRVHSTLGPGFLESVYQRALDWELRSRSLEIEPEHRLQVWYRGLLVGDFVADLIVGGCVIVELKAVRALTPHHEAQLVNYLAATRIDVGLLVNFGADRLQYRRKSRVYASRSRKCGEPLTAGAFENEKPLTAKGL
jgi:GxxExxY protein